MSKISQTCFQDEVLIQEEGIGWYLKIDTSKSDFPVNIGGESCGTELTQKEWQTLVPIVKDLIDQLKEYKNFSDESLILEIERDSFRACLEGFDDTCWSLKISFVGDSLVRRGFHLYWPIQSARSFVSAMRTMWDSYQ